MRGFLMSAIVAYDLKIGAELGTHNGACTFFLMDNAPNLVLHTVDIFEQQPDHPNYKDGQYDFTHSYPVFLEKAKKYGDRLIAHKGWTHEVAKEIEDGSLDFVFIDADHLYESVKRDILSWHPKLKPNGLLMGHDAHLPGVIKAVRECCKESIASYDNFCWVGSLKENLCL
jgi:predicted O-methyltransferase YrrM